MDRIVTYYIEETNNEKTILEFLKEQQYPKTILISLKKDPSLVLKNGKPSYLNKALHTRDDLKIHVKENESSSDILPVETPLQVIYEDEDILVIDKPSDMPIHPSLNHYEGTLANALANYFKNEDTPFVFRCLNRLDKNTSGLTLIAKNPLSAGVLSRQMKMREIKRTYYAFVSGIVKEAGIIDAPIARESDSMINRCVDFENGQNAITHYRPIKNYKDFTLMEFQLETGRTHQIRVHMKYFGHPLPADFIYNPDFSLFKRQPLHAGKLEFLHPVTFKKMCITSPLPQDIDIFEKVK